ncbi:MAG TPA: SDR family oxidoreductase [Candidatus Binataceae bacterium]|nr:SDR family oxidoreductase [Candidatus Binataceae bacterium]
MSGRLEGRVALITGGSSGIGRGACLRFAREGAKIVIADIDCDGGERTAAEIRREGGKAVFVRTDTRSAADNDAMAQKAVEEYGQLDILIASAGISHAGYDSVRGQRSQHRCPIIDKPLEQWERVIRVNLTGVMLSNQAAARRMMKAANGGAIVNVSSIAAIGPAPQMGDYSVSKAGVVMLSRVLALELAPHKIRVNCILPGHIRTPMTAGLYDDDKLMPPIGRYGEAADTAAALLFFASDDSSYITGKCLAVDGGRT